MGWEEPARIIARVVANPGGGRARDQGRAAVLEIADERRPDLVVEGDLEGLATLRPAKADDRARQVDIIQTEEPDARVAGRMPVHRSSTAARASSVAWRKAACSGVKACM